MKKNYEIFKIAISSKYCWIILFVSFIFFNTINFILKDLLYQLSIVNPKYIVFWTPDYYAFDAYNIPYIGLNYKFFLIYYLIIITILYFTNPHKLIDLRINKKLKIFLFITFILTLPVNMEAVNPYRIFLSKFVFEKISIKYGNFVKQDFRTNQVFTPFGIYKMHQKNLVNLNQAREIAPTMAKRCKQSIASGGEEYCYYYPWKITY